MPISDGSSDVCSSDLVEEAAARANATAGGAVVFAGIAVVIAISGLAVIGIPFLTVMGLAAAATVAVAVLVAVTLLPAMLGFRSEERGGGQECGRTCRSRGSPIH